MTVLGASPSGPRLERRLWLAWPHSLSLFRRRWLVIIGSAAVYLAGLAGAALFADPGPYIKSPAFILGAVGIAWVFASIRTRVRIVDDLYIDLHGIFSVDKKIYYDHVDEHFTAICRVRSQLFVIVPLTAANLMAAWVAFYRYPLHLGSQEQRSTRPWILDPTVYNLSSRSVYFGIVAGFSIPISIMIGMGAWLLLRELILVRSFEGLPVVPLASAVRARLKPLADFHVRVAIDWSLGAFLVFILFFRTPDVLSATAIGLLIFVGFATLIAPQLFLANVVRRAHEKSCTLVLRDYQEKMLMGSNYGRKPEYLADVATATERPRFWVYSVDELLRWLAAQLVAMTALYMQIATI